MFCAVSLSSGSHGNCLLIWTEKIKIMLDAGIRVKEIKEKLKTFSTDIREISAIFFTHEHTDHIKGGIDMSRKYGTTLWCNLPTLKYLKTKYNDYQINLNSFKTNQIIKLNDLTIKSFPVIHDAISPVGFSVFYKNKKICYIVDVSRFTDIIEKEISDADLVIIDSNYDRKSLIEGDYPHTVKQRIINTGHFSNEITANIIARHPRKHSTEFWLAHLSENNNMPEIADITLNYVLKKTGFFGTVKYKILPGKTIGPCWYVK